MHVLKLFPTLRWRLAGLSLASLMTLAACDQTTNPLEPLSPQETRGRSGARPAESVAWQATARDLITDYNPGPPGAARQLAYLSLAQYAAVVGGGRHKAESDAATDGAVAGASAAVLKHFFPAEAESLEQLVRSRRRSARGSLRQFIAGELRGRIVAFAVIARAQNDGFSAPFTGTIPVGPGYWFSSATPPAAPGLPRLGEMRPFFLKSGADHRPAPPPAFGSEAFLAGLAEVRQVALHRTAEQVRIAQFWALGAGTSLPPGYWNEIGARLVVQNRLDERGAAGAFLLLNGAMMDALIAGHDAKYAYWFIRPTQADPLISLAIGLPNHPSYPSTHTALSKSAAGVLGALFPRHRKELAAQAEEASMSRLYGGIHYRFDLEAGTSIAHGVVESALRAARKGRIESLVP